MSNYPDNFDSAAFDAQAPRYLSRDADADLATLDALKRRIAALAEMVNAWSPRTNEADDTHYALTSALDEAASAVRVAEDALAAREGVRL